MRYGTFDDENREYVIERPDVPVSWTNYLGVRDLCTVISHNAGGYTFHKSAENNRLTRFRPNAIPLDRPGHYVYLRDDDTGDFWSISWQPVGKSLDEASYEVRHGLSYTRFSCDYTDIHAEQLLFIPVNDDVELWDVTVKNTGDTPRNLSVFNYLEWSFQHVEIDNQNLQMSLYASGTSYGDGIIEYDFFYEPWTYHFLASSFEPDGYDCVRDTFLGAYRTESDPAAVEQGQCSDSTELGGNHCGALHKRLHLAPGEEARLVFILGVGSRQDAGRAAKARYSQLSHVDAAKAELKKFWDDKCARLQVDTPSQGMNSMLNTWTLLQAETCVVWSRFASFVEVGGRTGLGYRDTAQDVMSVAHTNPDKTRQRIVELLHGHTSKGYGLHLFDPAVFAPEEEKLPGVKLPTVKPTPSLNEIVHGLEDVCADDALWLVASTCDWVMETGETDFFDEVIPYADGGQGTVYEHLTRVLDFADEYVGPHKICQGLRADWNDCLNLGGGESSMVSFIHYWALQYFIEAADHLGRDDDVARYQAMAERVAAACEAELWDGDWYLRGFTKKGKKIGTAADDEGKLFMNAQTWAVYSGVAPDERGRKCMDAVDEHLFSDYGLHLLWPAYSKPDDDIGYVTRVYRGIKENGSIFSHPNPWAVIAECMLGRGDRAMRFYDATLPYHQNDKIEVRQAEPYSYCQFIMGRDHTAHGRARHPWLTGTGAWFYTAATKFILGVRPSYEGLVVDPCIPAEWDGFAMTRQWRGATYHIKVGNPDGVMKGVASVCLDGQLVDGPIPIQAPGVECEITVVMG
ncbi:MAG: N,N'-diacetylchitobiose phosphorylase [Gemmatimonadetes bacterium]|nr:N,N'-diacetylchitobiose phosphorylase [Gemmatimonadota bacterium]